MKLGESHNGGAVQQSSISCVLRRIGQICTCKRFLIPENICIIQKDSSFCNEIQNPKNIRLP